MEVVSIKVDGRIKEKMKRLSHVNWSEVLRTAIRKKIISEELERRDVDPKDLAEATELANTIRRPSPGWNSVQEIRRWRDRRESS